MGAPTEPLISELGNPPVATPDMLDDTPDQVKADLRKFNKTEAIVRAAVKSLTDITVIEKASDVDDAQAKLKVASGIAKKVDNKRLELSAPYREQVDRINDYAKGLTKDVQPAIDDVKKKILLFHEVEKTRLLNERTDRRRQLLVDLGLVYHKKEFLYMCEESSYIVRESTVVAGDDGYFEFELEQLNKARRLKAEQKTAALEKQLEGASFFGDDTAAAAIQEQIAEVKQAPLPARSYSAGSYDAPSTKGLTKRWVFEVTDAAQVPRAYMQVDEKLVRQAVADGARSIPGVRIYQEESISIR